MHLLWSGGGGNAWWQLLGWRQLLLIQQAFDGLDIALELARGPVLLFRVRTCPERVGRARKRIVLPLTAATPLPAVVMSILCTFAGNSIEVVLLPLHFCILVLVLLGPRLARGRDVRVLDVVELLLEALIRRVFRVVAVSGIVVRGGTVTATVRATATNLLVPKPDLPLHRAGLRTQPSPPALGCFPRALRAIEARVALLADGRSVARFQDLGLAARALLRGVVRGAPLARGLRLRPPHLLRGHRAAAAVRAGTWGLLAAVVAPFFGRSVLG